MIQQNPKKEWFLYDALYLSYSDNIDYIQKSLWSQAPSFYLIQSHLSQSLLDQGFSDHFLIFK